MQHTTLTPITGSSLPQLLPKQVKHLQGFDDNYEEHLPSIAQLITAKNKAIKEQKEVGSGTDHFAIPEAKPLLSKNYVDYSKPKMLMRSLPLTRQPASLYLYTEGLGAIKTHSDRTHLGKKEENKLGENNLWNKFINSSSYRLIYAKYLFDLRTVEARGHKKLKIELQKISPQSEYMMATYLIDLGFLSQAGTHLLKNLDEYEQTPVLPDPQNIEFDSRFECGNLMYAFERRGKELQLEASRFKEYYLILQNDINTRGYASWFYFSIRIKKASKLKLTIVNMQKSHSLHTWGMKVHVNYPERGEGWSRDGYNFVYGRNELLKGAENSQKYSSLSFCLDCPYDNDLIFISSTLPYSYSRLLSYLEHAQLQAKSNLSLYFRKEVLAMSISFNECPILTLTCKRQRTKQKKEEPKKKKKAIVVIARQHPSETVSSYIMEGLISSLIDKDDPLSTQLLSKYIFKIVPMVNVDGVIFGNSRCDIAGSDINRGWKRNPNEFIRPIVSKVVKLAQNLIAEGYEIDYFIDLHGHSRKMGSFLYGCKLNNDVESRQFAWFMAQNSSKFVFDQCKYGITQDRRETARGFFSSLVAGKRSYTLQTSVYGYDTPLGPKHFETKDLHKLGQALIQSIHNEQFRSTESEEQMKIDIKNAIAKSKIAMELEDDHSESDSNPEADEFTAKEKAETFLNPIVAAKVGLMEIKVIERKRDKPEHRFQSNRSSELETIEKKEPKYHQWVSNGELKSEILLRNTEKKTQLQPLKETKSLTKIQPFKFSVENEPYKVSVSSKKIRIAIEFQSNHEFKPQRLSSPTIRRPLPAEHKKFWSELKKQYDNIVADVKTRRQ